MPGSLFTLAAAVTAALPGVEVCGVRALGSTGTGRFDSALVTLADGTEVVARRPRDEDADRELAAQQVALRALTTGVREVLEFAAPALLGETRVDDDRVVVTSYIPGVLVEAADIPAGRGVAESIGESLARIHALPSSVVRAAGLPLKEVGQCRADVERLLDVAASSGRVPVRLMVRWREAVEDDRLWSFEPSVSLGGSSAESFLIGDDLVGVPIVQGVLDWHGLSVDDPAVDLRWIASAPTAADDIFGAYSRAAHRAPDAALLVRARLHAELEFLHWLVHGIDTHRPEVIDDAATLLESLSERVKDDVLLVGLSRESSDVDDALAAIRQVPQTPAVTVNTSMQTDAYDVDDLAFEGDASAPVEAVELPSAQPADRPETATAPLDDER